MIAAGLKAQQEPGVREPLLAQGYDLPERERRRFREVHCRGHGTLGRAGQIDRIQSFAIAKMRPRDPAVRLQP